MISKEELKKEYFKIYVAHKHSCKRDCSNCPVYNTPNPPGVFYNEFSGCGRREYALLKRFVPDLTQSKFIKINNGKSIFCGAPANGANSYEIAYKLYLLLCRRMVKI